MEMNTLSFLSAKDVANYLECSLPTARKIMSRKDFPAIKIGKSLKVEATAFHEWTQKRRT